MRHGKLVIIGNTTNARLAKWYFENDSSYEVSAFSVNKKYISSNVLLDKPVVPFEQLVDLYPPDKYNAFVAVGYTQMNSIREKLYYQVKKMGYVLHNYISSRCSFLTDEIIGDNNLILEDNTVQPYVKIGSNNVLWSGNHIGHDTVLYDHITVTSHVVISGYCKIGNNCFLGVNATLHNEIELSSGTLVAAGAIIKKNTSENEVYIPAKSILINKKSGDIGF